jgi:hypothetical protein
MKISKRYSKTTFTKRGDHEAGCHRTSHAPAEPAICTQCGAVYSDRRWTLANAPEKVGKHKHYHPADNVLCPACKQQQEGIPSGFVYLEGAFLLAHRDEIERLLRNEAERRAVDNPLARIMTFEADEEGRLIVTTTTEHLAERLGWSLERAFDGEVRFNYSHENKLARVYWKRD